MSEWRETTLGDALDIKHGWAFKGEFMQETNSPSKIVVAIGNFNYSGGFRFDSTRTKEYLGDYPKEYELKTGDILLAMTCQTAGGEILGIPGIIPEDNKLYLHNQRLGKVEIKDSTKIDISFVYWLCLWKKFNHHLYTTASGTKILHTAPERIKSFQFLCPPLEEQKAIAAVLSCLDAKIENLRKQNETLEAIAQTLFKHWFIDFEFLNEDGKPYKTSGGAMIPSELGEIPEGWQVLTLRKICEIIYRYPQFYGMEKVESGIPVIRGEHLLSNGRISSDFSNYWFVSNEYSKQYPKTILEEFDVVLSVRGSVGNYSVVGKKHIHSQISPNTIRLSSDSKILKRFLLYPLFKSNNLKRQLLMTVSSSAVPAINASEFKTFEFVIPSMDVQDRITAIFENLYTKIDMNEELIQTLTKTRDILLPKLMSGQLRVKD